MGGPPAQVFCKVTAFSTSQGLAGRHAPSQTLSVYGAEFSVGRPSTAITLKDTDWFTWKSVQCATGDWSRQALESLCLKCGRALDTFPGQQRTDLVAKAKSDRNFRADLMLMSEIQAGDRQRELRPSIVRVLHTMGFRVENTVALVDTEVFSARLGIPPGSLGTTAAVGQVTSYINEEGSEVHAIVMSTRDVPPDLPHWRASSFYETSSQMVEMVMTQDQQLRESQAGETLRWCGDQLVSDRPSGAHAAKFLKVWSFEDGKTRVEKIQEKRKADQAQESISDGEEEEAEAEASKVGTASTFSRPLNLRRGRRVCSRPRRRSTLLLYRCAGQLPAASVVAQPRANARACCTRSRRRPGT